MSREEAQRLLGGYATGTLTPAERRRLLEEAVTDQALFEELLAEQPLADLWGTPATRAQTLAVLERPTRRVDWRQWAGRLALATVAAGGAGIAIWLTRSQAPLAPSAPVTSSPTVASSPPPPALPEIPILTLPPALPNNRRALQNMPAPPVPPLSATPPPAGMVTLQPDVLTHGQPLGATPFSNSLLPRNSGESISALSGEAVGWQLRLQRQDEQGRYVALPPSAALHVGDLLRLTWQTDSGGYLYVLQETPPAWQVLWQSGEAAAAFTEYTASFTAHPRGERLAMILAQQPLGKAELQGAATEGTTAGGRVFRSAGGVQAVRFPRAMPVLVYELRLRTE